MSKKQPEKHKLTGNKNAAKANPRDKTITIRLTAGELAGVKRAAAAYEMTYTRYARIMLLNAALTTILP